MEDRNLVQATHREAEDRRVLIDVERPLNGVMQATEIERKRSIDEDPEIIVTAERERRVATVLKEVANFSCETEAPRPTRVGVYEPTR